MKYPERNIQECNEATVLGFSIVCGANGERTLQDLDLRDPDEVGLEGYRREELELIRDAVNENDFTILVAPAFSGKTDLMEKVLGAPCAIDIVRLGIRHKPHIIENYVNKLKAKLEREDSPYGEIVTIDELADDPTSHALVELCFQYNRKILAAVGGNRSNESKITTLGSCFGTPLPPHFLEMSNKPLNPRQIRALLERESGDRPKRIAPNFDLNTQEGREFLDDLVKLSKEFPIDPGFLHQMLLGDKRPLFNKRKRRALHLSRYPFSHSRLTTISQRGLAENPAY